MGAKRLLRAVLAVGMMSGAGAELPRELSPLAGIAAAKTRSVRAPARKRVGTRIAAKSTPRAFGRQHRRSAREQVTPLPPIPEPSRVENVAPSDDERRGRLQRALEMRAQQIALASIPPAPDVTSAVEAGGDMKVAAEPRSVSFDFESGLKTTTFPGDVVVREGFDTRAAKALAATSPAERPPFGSSPAPR